MRTTRWITGFILLLAQLPPATAADIRACGDIRAFKPAPYISVAIDLQSSAKEDAIAQMQRWADSKQYDEQVIILCRMLFEPRKGFEFRRPMLGGPGFYGKTTMKDWPLEPITLVDNIPFLIVNGYMLGGHAEEADSYLKYCTQNADWRKKPYREVTERQIRVAFDKLLKSPIWRQPLLPHELDWIEQQMK